MANFISKLIGKRKTAGELVDLLANTEAELSEAEGNRGNLVERRHRLLLQGTDDEVDQLDREIAETRRQCDRLVAAIGEIEARIETARDREHEDYLDAVAALGEKLAQRALSGYQSYAAMSADLIDLAVDDAVIRRRLLEVNRLLREAGRPEVIEPEARASTRHDRTPGPGISNALVLPNPGDTYNNLYNRNLFEKMADWRPAAAARLDRDVGTIPAAPVSPQIAERDDINEAA